MRSMDYVIVKEWHQRWGMRNMRIRVSVFSLCWELNSALKATEHIRGYWQKWILMSSSKWMGVLDSVRKNVQRFDSSLVNLVITCPHRQLWSILQRKLQGLVSKVRRTKSFACQCEGSRAACTTGSSEVSFPLAFGQGWLERNGTSCGWFKLWARKLVSESFTHAVVHIFQSKPHCSTVVWGTKVCVGLSGALSVCSYHPVCRLPAD